MRDPDWVWERAVDRVFGWTMVVCAHTVACAVGLGLLAWLAPTERPWRFLGSYAASAVVTHGGIAGWQRWRKWRARYRRALEALR